VAERLLRGPEVHAQVEALEHGGHRVDGDRGEVRDRMGGSLLQRTVT
jgi:hypothetical protein